MRTFRTLLVVVALFSFALLPAVSHAQDDAPVASELDAGHAAAHG